MGLMIDGRWTDQWYGNSTNDGRFKRQDAQFRNWITPGGEAGPSGQDGFKAEAGRYHLYVSYACPWAHRTLIFRTLKGLEKLISLSVVHWFMGQDGWSFSNATREMMDAVNHTLHLHEVYKKSDNWYTGRVTVPILWDKVSEKIVSNESSEIIRMFNSAFDQVGALPGDAYPLELRSEIDSVNTRIYNDVNNGVYKAGFATTQQAYDEAVVPLFDTLDWLEARLSRRRYLMGPRITEADWRLFTTLVRFDSVYVEHFKCNRRRLVDYPNLWAYTRDLYQQPNIAPTVNFNHIIRHYYESHSSINTNRIVPVGPVIDFLAPHGREGLL